MTLDIQNIKQRFEIIGTDPNLDRAIEKAMRVSPTDISVLITGESGVGKEIFPKIIHQLSHRKHNKFIAVNCGAIPEGTIDSELFGHEKGAFTGATSTRSGYFEVADGGTIFLDEVGELPMTTQVRLLRVLENGEFIKVGSSKVQKTNVRIVAATNVNMDSAIQKNKFREDLYYRLSTVEINIPPLRKRKDDIVLLFRKFASDFAKKYNMPTVRLDDNAQSLLKNYRWNGNIRQLKNVTEQLSVLEQQRAITTSLLSNYLPNPISNLPALIESDSNSSDFSSEREILYKILFDMKKDLNELKKVIGKLKNENPNFDISRFEDLESSSVDKLIKQTEFKDDDIQVKEDNFTEIKQDKYDFAEEIMEEETLSIQDKELELIVKSLKEIMVEEKLLLKNLESQKEHSTEKLNNMILSFRNIFFIVIISCIQSCGNYSFTGASIPEGTETFQVNLFDNNSGNNVGSIFEPGLDRDFTIALQNILENQTNLQLVQSNGDLLYEGEITEYRVSPMTATSDLNAAQNRLSISVNVSYTNFIREEDNFQRRFSFFFDFPAEQQLISVKSEAHEVIFERLTQDIFNASLAKW